jgi:plastocyanin
MKRFIPLLASTVVVAVTALPAQAATHPVSAQGAPGVSSFQFVPKTLTVAIGDVVKWTNNSPPPIPHTATQDGKLHIWNTGDIASGESKSRAIKWAGVFLYHCEYHASSGMRGKVRAPDQTSAPSGMVGDVFTITVASADAASGFVFDVQKRRGSGDWRNFKSGITSHAVTFKPKNAGTYSFRSRVRRTANGGASGYSPPVSITVTAAGYIPGTR